MGETKQNPLPAGWARDVIVPCSREAFLIAADIASEIVPRQNIVSFASDNKSYKGTVAGNEFGIILLQTRKDEIVLVVGETLARIPEIGEKVEIQRPKNLGDRREVSSIGRGTNERT